MTVLVRVWVPGTGQVELVTASGRVPMLRDPEAPDFVEMRVPIGTDYQISVDGREPYPDPRSAWQPEGVHGPSRAFDSAAFDWTDSSWEGLSALGAPQYELHIGTFTPEGTLDAAIGKLSHLAELGVRIVELMPVNAFPGERGWSYDGVGLYAVQDAYGGPEALQRFVDAAHGHGLGVCLDVVHNHLGPSGNYLSQFAPYFTDRHITPWGEGLDFDGPGSRPVRDFVVDNVLRWFRDFHIDALRLDAVHEIQDDSERHILAELSDRVAELSEELGRPLSLIAESDLNQAMMVTPTEQEGLGMTAQWADDIHHALHAYLTGEKFGYYGDFAEPGVLSHVMERVFLHEGGLSTFRGRNWGAPVPEGTDRRRFVAFTQNHDQVGNRALGDRPESNIPAGTAAAGAALLLMSPFTPMLFQGQEWGTTSPFQFFTDHGSDIGPYIAAGRRAEFAGHGWDKIYGEEPEVPDPQAVETFLASKLPWDELEGEGAQRMLAWYRELLALRAEVFGDGATHQDVRCTEGAGWIRLVRGPITVVAAPFETAVTLQLAASPSGVPAEGAPGSPAEGAPGVRHMEGEAPEPAAAPAEGAPGVRPASGEVVLEWGGVVVADGEVRLPPHSVAVLRS
ncbi:MAG TPA: malto-oligosyltrehalose trehalohydrolase [Actinomycetales bacterium]|nr:malto-oligosyltrehalose trehalohydrolase [Actinomycetales bacterium]